MNLSEPESSEVREPEGADAAPEASVERPPEADEPRASVPSASTVPPRVSAAEEDTEHSRSETAAPRFTHSSSGGSSVVGRTCLAEFEGKKFYAEILELKKSKVRFVVAAQVEGGGADTRTGGKGISLLG